MAHPLIFAICRYRAAKYLKIAAILAVSNEFSGA